MAPATTVPNDLLKVRISFPNHLRNAAQLCLPNYHQFYIHNANFYHCMHQYESAYNDLFAMNLMDNMKSPYD